MATTVPHTLPVDPARSQCKRTQEPNDQVLFTETFFTLGRYLCPSPSLPDVFLATPSPQHCPSCTPESSAMSQRFSLSPLQYRILTYETDSSHLCTQDSRNRRESKGAGLPFIEAAKLEIPCLPCESRRRRMHRDRKLGFRQRRLHSGLRRQSVRSRRMRRNMRRRLQRRPHLLPRPEIVRSVRMRQNHF